jgi:hypothetical protein
MLWKQSGEGIGRGGEGRAHDAVVAPELESVQDAGDFRLARIGGRGEGYEGAQSLLELERGARRRAVRGQFEIHDIAEVESEGQVVGEGHQIVGVRQISFEWEGRAAAYGDPDGVIGGHWLRRGDNGGERVRRVGGGDQGGRSEEREAGRRLRSAGHGPARDGEQLGAAPRDEEGVCAAEGLEEGGRGGGQPGVEGRVAELIEIDAGECDGGRRHAGGECGIDGGRRSGGAAGSRENGESGDAYCGSLRQVVIITGRATLAQLVERLIRNQQVAGSIPAGGSTISLQIEHFP